ncbi:TPA: ISL3 family transposase [Candidatus Magasanikbacteria bacterium]|nr:ISL3 family transposase [Candidatus Magasanikbacteria bacterium]
MAASKISKLFYKAFNLNTVILKSFDFIDNNIIFKCIPKESLKKCSCCHSKRIQIKETKVRKLRMVPIGKKKCFLEIIVYKFKCKDCKSSTWIKLPFACGKLPMTKPFVTYILSMIKMGTIKAVATFTSLNWNTVKNIHKKSLNEKYKKIAYKDLIYLSMDEFSIRKGHKYMTVFLDIQTGQIIYAVEGRCIEDISCFLQKPAKKAHKLKAIAMDLSPPFISAVKKYLPNVSIVFDHFHVTKIINQALDELRKKEWLKNNLSGEKKIGKGERFLFFRNYEDMEETQKGKLDQLLKINKTLATAYEMKEQFRTFWGKGSKQEGAKFLCQWIFTAVQSGIPTLAKVGKTFLRHYEGLLNYFDHRISNGKIEGINNKIKVQKRCGYGYRDIEYFTLLLYDLHKKTIGL